MLETRHIVGLDLGQVSDPTALVALRREQEMPELPKPKVVDKWGLEQFSLAAEKMQAERAASARYVCTVAERFSLSPSYGGYPKIVDNVVKLFQDRRFAGQTLVVDGTGVGRPVVDLFRKARINCRLVPVTITGGASSAARTLGQTTVDEWGYWHVPKKELVGCVQVLLGTDRLVYRKGLPMAPTLSGEIKNFRYKINPQTAHVSLEAWREADHDDLVLGLALAAWWGERARQELWVR